MFGRLKIKGKILLGYLVILAFTVIIAVAAIGWLLVQTNTLEDLYKGPSMAMEYASGMKTQVTEMQLQSDRLTNKDLSTEEKDKALRSLETATTGYENNYNNFEETLGTSSDEITDQYQKLGTVYNESISVLYDDILRAAEQNDYASLVDKYDDFYKHTEESKSILDNLIASSHQNLENSFTDTTKIFRISLYLILIAVAVAVVVDIITSFKISSSISRPINKLVNAAKQIALGDVNVNTDISGNDETAELGRAFQDVIDTFRSQAKVLDSIANGDYTAKIDVLSDEDIIGKTIEEILNKNNELINQIKISADEVATGSFEITAGAQSLATGSNE